MVNIEYSFLIFKVHDSVAELEELSFLQWFCKVVRDHVVCRTVFDFQFVVLDSVSYKIVTYIYMFSSLGASWL